MTRPLPSKGLIARILLLLPLVLLLAVCCVAWWILESENGTRWLWQRVSGIVPGELAAGSVDGALADGLGVADLRYASDAVEVTVDSLRLTMTPVIFPLAVDLADVSVGEVTIRLRQAPPPDEQSSDGASLADILSLLELPFPVRVDDLSLDALRVVGHDEREIFSMREVMLAGALHERLALEHARLSIGAIGLQASGILGLSAPNEVDATVDVAIAADAAEFLNDTPLRLSAALQGDFDELEVVVTGESPQFRLEGSVGDVAERPNWDVELRADALQWPLSPKGLKGPEDAEPPLVEARAVELASDGGLGGYTLHGTADVEIRGSGEMHTAIEASGDTQGIDIAALDVSGEPAAALLQGRLAWSPAFAVEAAGTVARFDLHRFVAAWPEEHAVSGSLDGAWQGGRIELAELVVRVENSPATLEAAGTIDPAAGVVDLAIEWQNLEWPLDRATAADTPQLTSDTGEIRLVGEPQDWQVDGRIELAVAGYPEGTFVLRGDGDREQVALSLAESRVLGGTAEGNVEYNWQAGTWSAALAAEGIHTEPVLAAWAGVLDAEFAASGQVRPFRIDLALDEFGGTMRGVAVAGSGGLRYGPGELRFRDFRIDSGDSSIAVDGMLRSREGIDFRVDVDALGTFLRPASGSVAANGNLAMPDGFPRLTLDFDGRDLGWQAYRAGRLTLDTVGGAGGEDGPLVLQLEGEEVDLAGRMLETVSARIAAGPDAQRLETEVVTADGTLAAVLDGAFGDWRRPLESGWQGELETLRLAAEPDAALVLRQPAPLTLSPETMALRDFCLQGDGTLAICGSGHWAGANDFHAEADLTAFPVDALRFVVDTGLEFTQDLDGSMTFRRTPERALSGDVELAISAGRIRNRLDERLAATTRPGTLQMHLENGQFLSGQLRLPVSEASEINAQFEVLDVARGEDSPVEGQLELVVNDIGIAARVTPMISAASGRLAADVTLSGTVGEPDFTGEGSLTNGSLTYEPLGLRLEALQLDGHIRDENRLELEGTFRAGDGSGRIYTSADYLNGAEQGLRVRLTGDNLTVIDVPDLRIVADPDLDFGLDDGTIMINGSIEVPRARLSPVNLATNTVRESEDVVVVAGQEEEVEETAEEENGLAIRGEVELTLGDDIVVDLDVADAKVTGDTTFRWSGPVMPVADGQYRVSGSFQAYGQLLQITEGIVNFPNVPADNPVLRIRAEREIFGNSQIRSAGVSIAGTAKDPEVDVYTNPPTTESRALSLLVTGSDFNYEQGVGAVDVGTYIAPKLYLSYGIGLFDRENVISVRYDIARGFGIKASSSTRTDGVDLSYTIEN